MKHILKTRTKTKRWLALALCLCMAFPSAMTLVSVAEEPPVPANFAYITQSIPRVRLCSARGGHSCNHTHDEDCGYQAPTEGSPCNHVHDDSCGYQEPTEGVSCNMGCTDEDGDGNIIHQEGCAYQPAEAGQPCTHSHDENCGYQAALEGSPCTHVHDETLRLRGSYSRPALRPHAYRGLLCGDFRLHPYAYYRLLSGRPVGLHSCVQ